MVVGMRSNRTSIFMFDYLFIIIGHKLCTPDKYIYTHTYICTYVCMHIYIYVCMHTCMYQPQTNQHPFHEFLFQL